MASSAQSAYSTAWTATQDKIVLKSMVALILANRPEIYANPDLAAFAGNGGDRIHKKIRQFLEKSVIAIAPEAGDLVKEEMANMPKRGGGGNGASPKRKKAQTDDGSDFNGSPKKGRAGQASPGKVKASKGVKAGAKVKSEGIVKVEEVKSEGEEAEAHEKPQVSEEDE